MEGSTLSHGSRPPALQVHRPITQPGVSQHLRVLREAGLVTVRAEGTRRVYAVDSDGLDAARAWLAQLDPLAPIEQPLDALATEDSRGQRAGRHTTRGVETSERMTS